MIWKLLKFHQLRPEKTKKPLFAYFRLYEGYVYRRAPIVNPFLQSFWGVNQLYLNDGSRNMENHAISSLWSPKKQKIAFLGALPVIGGVYISQTTDSKVSLAVILSGQSTLYDEWFKRYVFLDNFGVFGSNFGPKNKFRQPFSLIIKSIFKIDPLRNVKQLLSWSLQKLDGHPSSSTGL